MYGMRSRSIEVQDITATKRIVKAMEKVEKKNIKEDHRKGQWKKRKI